MTTIFSSEHSFPHINKSDLMQNDFHAPSDGNSFTLNQNTSTTINTDPQADLAYKPGTYFCPKPNILGRWSVNRNSVSNMKHMSVSQFSEDTKINNSFIQSKSFFQERDNAKRSIYSTHSSDSRSLSQRGPTNARSVSAKPSAPQSGNNTSRSPIPVSENFIKRMERARTAKIQAERLGAEGLEVALHRKSLEEQVAILENRLNKLKVEDDLMAKKIKETSEKTEKILEGKRRRQEELHKKEMMNRKRQEDLQRRRNDLLKEKQDQKNSLRRATLHNFKKKHEIAYSVKMDNEYHKMLKEEIKRQRDERNRITITKIQGVNNVSMAMKQVKEEAKIYGIKYNEKISRDKERSEELAQKCKDLEKLEHQMLEKLSQTYNIHKSKVIELERAFVMKVKPDEE